MPPLLRIVQLLIILKMPSEALLGFTSLFLMAVTEVMSLVILYHICHCMPLQEFPCRPWIKLMAFILPSAGLYYQCKLIFFTMLYHNLLNYVFKWSRYLCYYDLVWPCLCVICSMCMLPFLSRIGWHQFEAGLWMLKGSAVTFECEVLVCSSHKT